MRPSTLLETSFNILTNSGCLPLCMFLASVQWEGLLRERDADVEVHRPVWYQLATKERPAYRVRTNISTCCVISCALLMNVPFIMCPCVAGGLLTQQQWTPSTARPRIKSVSYNMWLITEMHIFYLIILKFKTGRCYTAPQWFQLSKMAEWAFQCQKWLE